jgi:antitoxin MazE
MKKPSQSAKGKRVQVVRWGNSQAVRLPKQILEEARIVEGEELLIRAGKRSITLEPISPALTLAMLVAAIDANEQHGETDWGAPEGREEW